MACQKKNTEIIKLLIAHNGIDINAIDDIFYYYDKNKVIILHLMILIFTYGKNQLNMLTLKKSKIYSEKNHLNKP